MGVTKAIFRVLVRKEEVAVGSGLSQWLESSVTTTTGWSLWDTAMVVTAST